MTNRSGIWGEPTNNGQEDHNYLVVNDDGSINTSLLDDSGNPIGISNPLPVELPPMVSTNNSTTTTLGISGEFTGASEEINGYGIIYVNTYSDQASAEDGLKIEQSSDGTNWDHCDEFTIPAETGKNFSINPYAKYLRVRYVNGQTAQTEFRLQTILKTTGKSSSHRIQDSISSDDDAELVKSALTGQDKNGTFQNVATTEDGNLTISDNSSGLAIAQGNVTGQTNVNKFGNAPDFDTGDGEVDIWDGANDGGIDEMSYTFSTTADIDRLSSSSASDTVDIEIQGLNEEYTQVTQTITLNGQTPVALDTPLLRVFRMKNVGATDLVGDVYCFVNGTVTGGVPDTTSDIRGVIDNGNNQTEMAIYTVPAGRTGYIRELYASTAGGSRATNYVVKLKIRPFGQVFQLKHRRAINDDKDLEKKFDTPEVATEMSDIIVTAETTEPAITGSNLSAGFDIIVVDENLLWDPSRTTTALWLDATDSDTITEASGFVSQWDDKSGNDNHAVQATGSRQPQTGVEDINGFNAIDFSAASDNRLVISDDASIKFDGDDGFGMFMVFNRQNFLNQGSGINAFISKGNTAQVATGYSFYTGSEQDEKWKPGVNALSESGDDRRNENLIISADSSISATTSNLWINGTLEAIDTSGSHLSNNTSDLWIGGDSTENKRFANFYASEIVLTPGTPSEALRQKIEGYLAHKYALQLSLPTDHPYRDSAPMV